MAHTGWFRNVDLGEEWNGYAFALLARVCAGAQLTNREAEVVNLYCRGLSIRDIGATLAVNRPDVHVWRSLRSAVKKIAAKAPERRDARRQEVREILSFLRNGIRRDHGPLTGFDQWGQAVEIPRVQIVTVDDLVRAEESVAGALATLEALAAAARSEPQGEAERRVS